MPFVQRKALSPELREVGNDAFKKLLRESLLNPALSAEQRQLIQEELTMLENGGRVYDANRPPSPGAISFEQAAPGNPNEEG